MGWPLNGDSVQNRQRVEQEMTPDNAAVEHPRSRKARFVSLIVGTSLVALAVFFLVRRSWWMSLALIVLWIGVEWWGVWDDKRRREAKRRKANADI
jgi:hypothetical protein